MRPRTTAGVIAALCVAVLPLGAAPVAAARPPAAVLDPEDKDSTEGTVEASADAPPGRDTAERIRKYWTADRLSRAPYADPAHTVSDPDDPQRDPDEDEDTAGPTRPDTRATGRAVMSRPVGMIFFHDPVAKKDMRCSGSVVRSTHKMLVATAGHCVHTGKGGRWVQNLVFIPGYDVKGTEHVRPHGTFAAEKVRAMNGWTKRSNQGRDVAFFRVTKSDLGKGLESEVGAQGYAFGGRRFGVKVTAIGYPSSHKFTGNAQQKKCADATRRSGQWKQLRIDCDLTKGASGGPWLRDYADGYGRIMSVNSNMPKAEKEVDGPQFDLAVRAMYRKID
ncbi:peptidase [Pilimelia terevasa]|uniref:Peptidase n=1 Tax=Pilimelia terevasa TaxID=53372 RepID=A0A8J3FJ86_9ACTN|nr:trypsin-like peptidase domain-containing protein [Pilimelia terevasa]GGK28144.1 peptidase [Pilimelia terevasa]